MAGRHAELNPASQSFRFTMDYQAMGLPPTYGKSPVVTWDHKAREAVWQSVSGAEHRTGYHVKSVRDSLRRKCWVVQEILS